MAVTMSEARKNRIENELTTWLSYADSDDPEIRWRYKAVAFGAESMLMALGYFVSYTDGKAKISR